MQNRFLYPFDSAPPVFCKSFNDSLISGIEEDWSTLFVPPVFSTRFQLKFANMIVNVANIIVNIANMIVNIANV